jgi:hypothetical protein
MSSQLKYGVLSGLVLGVVLFISMFFQPSDIEMTNPWANSSGIVGILLWFIKTGVVFVLFYLAAKEIRDTQLGGYIAFGKAFRVSYSIALYTILVYAIIAALYYFVFNPDWFPLSWDQFVEITEENANGEDMSEAISIMKPFYDLRSLLMIGWLVISNLFGLAILSLVIGGVVQKDDPNHVNL